MEFYTLKVAGLTRELPLCAVNEKLDIAAFIMFSDVELTVAVAEGLLAKCPDFDIIVTAESKGIPLAYEMARQAEKNYVVARKSVKVYMQEPVFAEVNSITTRETQRLYFDKTAFGLVGGKRVLVLDDVISTGESLYCLLQLVGKAGGNVVGKVAVLAEGDAADRDDIIFLEKLPLFFK